MIVLNKPLEIGDVYEGKLYTRLVEDVWGREVKVMTIASIEGRKPGPRPRDGLVSLYGFKIWMLKNGLAYKEERHKKRKPEQLRLW